MDINEAVVLVTGASSGIGAATERAASREGAQIVLIARREDRIRQLAAELGDAISFHVMSPMPIRSPRPLTQRRAHSDGSTS